MSNGGRFDRGRIGYNNFRGGRTHAGQFNRGRGRFGQNKPQCQLCLRFRHIVLNFYYRFDQSFQGVASDSQQQMNANLVTSNSQSHEDHYTTDADQQMSAFMMSLEGFLDPGWVVDSEATNHCTSSSSNIQSKASYHGKDQIYMGDGTGVNISGTGKLLFSLNNHKFLLSDVLHILVLVEIF